MILRFASTVVLLSLTSLSIDPVVSSTSITSVFTKLRLASQVTLSGSVTTFEWTNPHAYIEIDVTDDKGAVKHWSVEMGSPSILMQSGWKFKDLKHGDKVTVRISPLKDGKPGGLLVQATLPDGRVLGNGPGRGPAQPAAGAPNQ